MTPHIYDITYLIVAFTENRTWRRSKFLDWKNNLVDYYSSRLPQLIKLIIRSNLLEVNVDLSIIKTHSFWLKIG